MEDNVNFYNDLAGKSRWNLDNGRRLSLSLGIYRKTFNDIQNKLNIQNNDVVLDLGGGTGRITKYISEICKIVELSDAAATALDLAKDVLKGQNNIVYSIVDIGEKLPYGNEQFDKVLCYSTAHYLENYTKFENLIRELLRITKKEGQILIGDIPLKDKYKNYLENRKKFPVKNFLMNLRYRLKKIITDFMYRINGISYSKVRGLSFIKKDIEKMLGSVKDINYFFLEQNYNLPYASSREDILIKKL